jgi:hypothetical protein
LHVRPVLFLVAIAAAPALAALGVDAAQARRGLGRGLSQSGVCSVFSRHSCAPTACSVFRHEPCVPDIQYLGETLQLTIVTDAADGKPRSADNSSGADGDAARTGPARGIGTIRGMFDALRACWVPPPEDQALPGMQMSVRFSFRRSGEIIDSPRVTYASPDAPPGTRAAYHDAITAALGHCSPLPFTDGLGGAVAGHPIAIRFVDNRKIK